MQHGGAVEELIVHRQRQADDGDAGKDLAAGPAHLLQGIEGGLLKQTLVEQVGAGVAGQRQFGKDDDGHGLGLACVSRARSARR